MPRSNMFKIGVAAAGAAAGAILAITSVFAHSVPSTSGTSIVGGIVSRASDSTIPDMNKLPVSNELVAEQEQDAQEAAELAAKIAAEQAAEQAEAAARAAADACHVADQTEDTTEKAADKTEDAAEKTNGTESDAEDTAEKAGRQAADKTEDASEVKCAKPSTQTESDNHESEGDH